MYGFIYLITRKINRDKSYFEFNKIPNLFFLFKNLKLHEKQTQFDVHNPRFFFSSRNLYSIPVDDFFLFFFYAALLKAL